MEAQTSGETSLLDGLEFPDGRSFVSRFAPFDPQAVYARCEELLPLVNTRGDDAGRRLAEKIDVEFAL